MVAESSKRRRGSRFRRRYPPTHRACASELLDTTSTYSRATSAQPGKLRPLPPDRKRAAAENSARCGVFYGKPIRVGGQYVKKTCPIRFSRGTAPQRRESQDCQRLSPMKKYSP